MFYVYSEKKKESKNNKVNQDLNCYDENNDNKKSGYNLIIFKIQRQDWKEK